MSIINNINEVYDYVVSNIIDSKPDVRPGLTETINEILDGYNVILSAPPSYGKTNIPYTLAYLASERLGPWTSRVIHILPLRSIIEDIYRRLFIYATNEVTIPKIECLNEKSVAKQMMGFSESPYLQKTLVLTTIDTFTLTSIRIPPPDSLNIKLGLSLGHGEYSRSSILTSTPIFDEIQLFLEEDKRLVTILCKLIDWLSFTKTPILLMSATLPSSFEKFLSQRLEKVKVLKYGRDFRSKDFENKKLSNTIIGRKIIIENMDELIAKTSKIIKEGNFSKILIVTNTVKKCIYLASKLREFDPIPLHGKIISKERLNRLNKIAKLNQWILVSTQVIEAGVDVSSNAMITEAAPPTSLIQRVGRLLRKEENEEGSLIIFYDKSEEEKSKYTVYPKEIVFEAFEFISENLNKMNWHLPLIAKGIGYEKFMEHVYLKTNFSPKIDPSISNILSRILFKLNVSSKDVLHIMNYYGSIIREQPLIIGLVQLNSKINFEVGYEYSVKELRKLFIENSFPLSFYDLAFLSKFHLKALKMNLRGNITCLELNLKRMINNKIRLYRFINNENIIAIIIPPKLYNENYGFMVK